MPGTSSESRLEPDAARAAGGPILIRRFDGPLAEEIAILVRPDERKPRGLVAQVEAAYEVLAEALAVRGATAADLASETLFVRDARGALAGILGARGRALRDGASPARDAFAAAPTLLQQAPVEKGAEVELLASAVVPRDRGAASVRDVAAETTCPCEGCRTSRARLVRIGEQVSLHTTSLHGTGDDAFAQASEMFRAADRLLAACGMDFGDVVRTWIHLRDIDRDYDALNRARREFFGRRGIERLPASTGIQGNPLPAAHVCSLSLHAVKLPRPLDVGRMSTPLLNEAWSYGADFSRGLRVVETNKVALHVSGTASIGADGATVHVGDFEAQAERMVENVESLLAGQGATFASLMSGIVYLKRAGDAPILRKVAGRRGFDAFPCAVVVSDLCRPELLCETEVVAMLPLAPGATLAPTTS